MKQRQAEHPRSLAPQEVASPRPAVRLLSTLLLLSAMVSIVYGFIGLVVRDTLPHIHALIGFCCGLGSIAACSFAAKIDRRQDRAALVIGAFALLLCVITLQFAPEFYRRMQ